MLGDLGRVCSPLPSCFAVFSENFNFFLLFSECFQFPCSQFLVGCGDFSLFAAVFSLFSCFPWKQFNLSESIDKIPMEMLHRKKLQMLYEYTRNMFSNMAQ